MEEKEKHADDLISQYLAAATKTTTNVNDEATTNDKTFNTDDSLDSIKVNENDLKQVGAAQIDENGTSNEMSQSKTDNTDISSTINK